MGIDRTVLFRLATNERLERTVKAFPGGEASSWRLASRYVAGRSRAGGTLPEGLRIQVGAENAARADSVWACVLDVAGRGLADRLGATVQANLLRAPADAEALAGAKVHLRLVKGAYVGAGAYPFGSRPGPSRAIAWRAT